MDFPYIDHMSNFIKSYTRSKIYDKEYGTPLGHYDGKSVNSLP